MSDHFDAAAYQAAARRTAIYPNLGNNISYPAHGLAGEAAEVLEKILEDGPDHAVLAEVGDVLWYASQLGVELGIPLEQVAPEPGASEEELSREVVAALDVATRRADANLSLALAADLSVAVGKVSETVKKVLRDRGGVVDDDVRARAAGQLARVVVALAALAYVYDQRLATVAATNLEKLASRAAASTLQGDGDER